MKLNKMLCDARWLKRLVTLTLTAILASNLAIAQTTSISGVVTYAEDGTPIIGATVIVADSNVGTVTDAEGKFSIKNAPTTGSFMVSYLGYKMATESIVAGKNYTIALESDSEVIEDVVVVGYGTMRKKEVTGAVARVDSEQLTKISTADVGSALQGQIAGVNIQASSGAPGATANIQIRGVSSINGSNGPLFVVDGVPSNSDPELSPGEIESIDVLKDAASAAIYGTRGAGGVILITTKKGTEGEPKITLDAYYGVQKITSALTMMDASESMYQDILKQTNDNGYNSPWYSFAERELSYLNDTDIVSLIEQDNQPVYNISLSASGGNKGLTYSVVANYYNQEGVVINSGFDRLNIRANTAFTKKKWKFTANISSKVDNTEATASSLYSTIYKYSPTANNFDPDTDINASDESGDSQVSTLANALAKFKENTVTEGRGYTGNFSVSYDILDNLTFTSRLGTGYTVKRSTYMKPLFEVYNADGELYYTTTTRSQIKETTRTNTNFSWEQMLSYGKKWDKHDLKATAVFGAEKYTYDTYYAQRYDLISNSIPGLSSATGEASVGSGDNTEATILGMLGRVQYSYDSRYMFSASLRRDGSSRFAEENRWGYFPSVSAGWYISEEEFFQPIQKVVNGAKFRASYGTTGNQNFNDYEEYAVMESGRDYAFGGTGGDNLLLGTTQVEYSNADVKWETTQQLNFGLDLFFLDSKLNFTADWYRSSKENMLFPLTVPYSSGAGSSNVILNVGNMTNQGVELALGYSGRSKNFTYNVNATFAKNVNEITKMAGTNKEVVLGSIKGATNTYPATYIREGYEAGAYFLLPTNGIINTDKKLVEYQKIDPAAVMGDLIYVDTNGDGSITDADREYYGCGAPNAELGFNANMSWKSFDFSFGLYASLGNEIINGSKLASYQYGRNLDLLYQWSRDNQLSTIPRFGGASHDNHSGSSDQWVEDGTFLRLRNISLGYTLPKKLVSKVGISRLRVYVAADNILTLTKYSGYDPEVGNDGLKTRGLDAANYPITAQIRGGVQINF